MAAAIARGFDAALPVIERVILYLPFEHSEDLADQRRSVALYEGIAETPPVFAGELRRQVVFFARRHHEIVARFGRFPHRNQVLGRESTPEEIAFLDGPNSSF